MIIVLEGMLNHMLQVLSQSLLLIRVRPTVGGRESHNCLLQGSYYFVL